MSSRLIQFMRLVLVASFFGVAARSDGGQWAVVTGASSGIGSALAERAASQGLHVVLCGRDRDALKDVGERVRKSYGVDTDTVVADLAEGRGAERLHKLARQCVIGRGGRISALAANAGVCRAGKFSDQGVEDIDRVLSVNVRSVAILCRLFEIDIDDGVIVVTGSIAGLAVGIPGVACYAATKAFVRSFATALDAELAPKIRVLAFLPGAVGDTKFAANSGLETSLVFGGSRLLRRLFVMNARDSVRGVSFLKRRRGRTEIIPGFFNKCFGVVADYLPKPAARTIGRLAFYDMSHQN